MANAVACLNIWRIGIPCVGPTTLTIDTPANNDHVCEGGNLLFTWHVDACSDQVTVDWAGHYVETLVGGSGSITGLIEAPGTYTLTLTATGGSHPTQSINITIDHSGCTDPAATNYDPTALCDNGSCSYTVFGCTDPGACNYNSAATTDDGSCCYTTGCTDTSATNYNPAACCDDGSCTYITGCTDASACNYDPTATRDDGSCTYPGCTDPVATNYNPSAGCDDGSCTY